MIGLMRSTFLGCFLRPVGVGGDQYSYIWVQTMKKMIRVSLTLTIV